MFFAFIHMLVKISLDSPIGKVILYYCKISNQKTK